MCKIVPVRNAFIAVSGMVRDPARQFDVEELAARAFDSKDTFQAHVRYTTRLILVQGTKELQRLRNEDPEQYRFALTNHGNAIDILFVAFEKGVPIISARRFHWNETILDLEIAQKQDCPGADCPTGVYLSKIGEVGEIERYIDAHKTESLNEGTLRDLMVQQTKATPNYVGLPIEILSLKKSGATWHANDLGCPLQ